MQAALREVAEETGLHRNDLRIIPGFQAFERFYFRIGKEGIHDTVILYLAETRKADIRIDPREHSGFAWFTYHDALKAVGTKYESTRKVLKQANDYLTRRPRPHAS